MVLPYMLGKKLLEGLIRDDDWRDVALRTVFMRILRIVDTGQVESFIDTTVIILTATVIYNLHFVFWLLLLNWCW
jgi:hypothetical protein